MKNDWQRIDLNGDYALAWQDHDDYLMNTSVLCKQDDFLSEDIKSIVGKVPGNFELDMLREGLIEDPFWDENNIKAQELERLHVFYSKEFTYTADSDAVPYLVFEGVDTVADIYLNGTLIGSCKNMFVIHEFDVSKHIAIGKNELFVHIYPASIAARENDISVAFQALRYNYETLRLRKAPHMFGWDIMPRLVSAGLYRPVYLQQKPTTRLKQNYLMTTSVDTNLKTAHLELFYEFETLDASLADYTIEVSGVFNDSKFSVEARTWFTAGRLKFDLENVRFWWPKGYGEPALYSVQVSLKKNGVVKDFARYNFGIRTVNLIRTGITDEYMNGKFHFEVNGTQIFVLGTNFVPIDAYHSRDRDRLPKVMELLDDIGCNMIRIWGGGVYEDDFLYDTCDELGILVWQDFMMACGRYPTDNEFAEVMHVEAKSIIRRLRHHSSIILWSGDNECDQLIKYAHASNFAPDPNKNYITRRVLQDVVDAEDPTRPYLPSSPFIDESASVYPDDKYLPENHLWGPRDYFKSNYYTSSLCNFVSEIGYHGCPSKSSLQRFLPENKLWPWYDNTGWIAHAASPEVSDQGSYAYRIELMAKQIKELFGLVPDNLDDFIFTSQVSQAEAFKFFIELFRLGQPKRTGIIWWNLIDGWPQFSDAVVDYYYEKKLAYNYIKQVQQPTLLSIKEPKKWFCSLSFINDSRKSGELSYRLIDYTDNSKVLVDSKRYVGEGVTELFNIPYSQGEVKLYVMEWESEMGNGRNHYLAGNPPFDLEMYREFLAQYYSTDM